MCVCGDCHKASAYAGNCLCVMEWLRVANETDEPTQRKRQHENKSRGRERGIEREWRGSGCVRQKAGRLDGNWCTWRCIVSSCRRLCNV